MKRSALSVLLAAAVLCQLPTAALAQANRSRTDAVESTRWLASDALTFAFDVYEMLHDASHSRDVLYMAQVEQLDSGPPVNEADIESSVDAENEEAVSDCDTSGCGWTCYPSDYGCFSYDYAYRSSARITAVNEDASEIDDGTRQDANVEDTSLIDLPGDEYPCMGAGETSEGYAISINSSVYDEAAAVLRDAVNAIQSQASAQRVRGERLIRWAADHTMVIANHGLAWLNEQRTSELPARQELVIQPLYDVVPVLESHANLLQFARAPEPDYEWQVALEYYGQHGCPSGVWDAGAEADTVSADYSPGLLNYWAARLTAQATIRVLARSGWVNTAHDAIVALRTRHAEMIAANSAVPEIPLQEFMFDNSTYVTIDDDNSNDPRVASGASVRSLSQAVLNAVRQSWTAHTAVVESGNATR